MKEAELTRLLRSLLNLPNETEWLEFKVNNSDPEKIGEYLSALANSAALHQQDRAYLLWGVDDSTHQVLGTSFQPHAAKVGNEALENWLTRLLIPDLDFRIHEFQYEQNPIVLFEIPPASHTPIRFKENEFIRVGSYKKKLKDYPDKERNLWTLFQQASFEKGIALPGVSAEQVTLLLDYPNFFQLLHQPLPENRSAILERLEKERIIIERHDKFDITNLQRFPLQ